MLWFKLWEFETRHFRLVLEWQHESDPDLSWMDDSDRARIDSGEWTTCIFRVAVYLDGIEIAADYLGDSVYANPAEFAREHLSGSTSYFRDMVAVACSRAREHVRGIPKMREA